MNSIFAMVDDKHVPLYHVIWVADVPHFCGSDECTAEGRYEIRLVHDESVWANGEERDGVLAQLERWSRGPETERDWN